MVRHIWATYKVRYRPTKVHRIVKRKSLWAADIYPDIGLVAPEVVGLRGVSTPHVVYGEMLWDYLCKIFVNINKTQKFRVYVTNYISLHYAINLLTREFRKKRPRNILMTLQFFGPSFRARLAHGNHPVLYKPCVYLRRPYPLTTGSARPRFTPGPCSLGPHTLEHQHSICFRHAITAGCFHLNPVRDGGLIKVKNPPYLGPCAAP
jgi:hypothetical protein